MATYATIVALTIYAQNLGPATTEPAPILKLTNPTRRSVQLVRILIPGFDAQTLQYPATNVTN
jgi:hypothetical protein